MTFPYIQNPLGSAGYGGQSLGDLSAGLQAIQQTEISRRLKEIDQEKADKKSAQAKNEDFFLTMASVPFENEVRVKQAVQASKDADAFVRDYTSIFEKAQKEGRVLTLEEKMNLIGQQRRILETNARAKSFSDALSANRMRAIETRSKLTPEQQAIFDQQWKNLYDKIQDPKADVSAYNIMEAMQAPEPTASMIMGGFQEQTKGNISNLVRKGAQEGTSVVDEQALSEYSEALIPSNSYEMKKLIDSGRYGNDDIQVREYFKNLVRGQVKQDLQGFAPSGDGSGDPTKRSGLVFAEDAQSFGGSRGNAVQFTGRVPSLSIIDKPSGAQFGNSVSVTPVQVMKDEEGNTVLMGRQTVKADEVKKGVSQVELRMLKNIPKLNYKTIDKGDGRYDVVFTADQTIDVSIPYERVREQMEKYYPQISEEEAKLTPTATFVRSGGSIYEMAGVKEPNTDGGYSGGAKGKNEVTQNTNVKAKENGADVYDKDTEARISNAVNASGLSRKEVIDILKEKGRL